MICFTPKLFSTKELLDKHVYKATKRYEPWLVMLHWCKCFLLLGRRAIGMQTAQVYHYVDKASRQKLVYIIFPWHARHREHTPVPQPCPKAASRAHNLPPYTYSAKRLQLIPETKCMLLLKRRITLICKTVYYWSSYLIHTYMLHT